MSELRDFFRTCPACGRKFHIRLVGEKLVDDKRDTENIMKDSPMPAFFPNLALATEVEENVPVTVDIQEFQFTYRCKHCGHVWSEMHEEKHNA